MLSLQTLRTEGTDLIQTEEFDQSYTIPII